MDLRLVVVGTSPLVAVSFGVRMLMRRVIRSLCGILVLHHGRRPLRGVGVMGEWEG